MGLDIFGALGAGLGEEAAVSAADFAFAISPAGIDAVSLTSLFPGVDAFAADLAATTPLALSELSTIPSGVLDSTDLLGGVPLDAGQASFETATQGTLDSLGGATQVAGISPSVAGGLDAAAGSGLSGFATLPADVATISPVDVFSAPGFAAAPTSGLGALSPTAVASGGFTSPSALLSGSGGLAGQALGFSGDAVPFTGDVTNFGFGDVSPVPATSQFGLGGQFDPGFQLSGGTFTPPGNIADIGNFGTGLNLPGGGVPDLGASLNAAQLQGLSPDIGGIPPTSPGGGFQELSNTLGSPNDIVNPTDSMVFNPNPTAPANQFLSDVPAASGSPLYNPAQQGFSGSAPFGTQEVPGGVTSIGENVTVVPQDPSMTFVPQQPVQTVPITPSTPGAIPSGPFPPPAPGTAGTVADISGGFPPASTPPADVGGGVPPASGGGDVLGGISKSLGNILSSPFTKAGELLLPLGVLAAEAARGPAPVPSFGQQAAGNTTQEQALGQQLLEQGQTGQLSPSQLALINQQLQGTINQLYQFYAQSGRDPTHDTDFIQAVQQASAAALAQYNQFIQTAIQQGIAATSGANQTLLQLAQIQAGNLTAFNNQLTQALQSFALLAGLQGLSLKVG